MGVIDTITAGFRTLSRRVWVILLPIALDLWLWRGPKLSIAPLVEEIIAWFEAAFQSMPAESGAVPSVFDFQTMAELLREVVGARNLFGLLAWGRLGFPSVAAALPINVGTDRVIALNQAWLALLWQVSLWGGGLLLTSVFLLLVSQAITDERPRFRRFWGRAIEILGGLVLVFVPFSFMAMMALTFGALLGPFVVFVGVGVLWVAVFIAFVPQAITLAHETPWRAIVSSFVVVRFNLWRTIALLVLVNVLSTGLGLIFVRLLQRGPFLVGFLAIAANAYVGTALTTALFIFYRDRLAMLREMAERERMSRL